MRSILYVSFVLLCLMAGCTGNGGYGRRGADTERRLKAVSESLDVMSPSVLPMIVEGMAAAEDSAGWYEFYVSQAKYHYLLQQPDSMLPYIRRTLAFAERQKPQPRILGIKAHAQELMADYYQMYRASQHEVIRYRTMAYGNMMQSDDKDFLPEICANMADVYVQLNDMARAASWYRRALFLVDSLRLPEIKNVTLYLGLANIYTQTGDYESSLRYYRECGRYYDRMPLNMQAYYLNNFGNYYYFRGDYAAALKVFKRLEALLGRFGDTGMDISVCRINLADVYLNLGDTDRALSYVEQAERFFMEKGVTVGVFYARSIRIGIAVRLGRIGDVPAILAADTLPAPPDPSLVSIRAKYMQQYYEAAGDYRRAFEHLRTDMRKADSTELERKGMRASEIMQRLREDTLKLHHEIEMRAKDGELRYTWGSALVVVVVALLVLLWRISALRRRRLQTEMDMMRLRLDNARNRMSPHFIFNVLNNYMSTVGEKEREGLMTLVKLIRANLDMSRNVFVTISDELDFVRYYVDVERRMLGDGFTFSVDMPDDKAVAGAAIPSMSVQILVENAIKHGLKGMPGPKRLTVRVCPVEGGTDIFVTDNGHGFDIREAGTGGTRTGLDIIRHTIRIINGKKKNNLMELSISNIPGSDGMTAGCEARLHIPDGIREPDGWM